MEEKLLTYGLREGKLKYILDVSNGLACNCKCPKCAEALIAKNNPSNKKAPHFAHSSGTSCVGAYESALHILAKEVFEEMKEIRAPDYHHDYNSYNAYSIFKKGKRITFEKIFIEKALTNAIGSNTIVADAIGEINGKQLILEFAKTHFINEEKRNKLLELNVACIEIDLSNQALDHDEIKKFFLSDSPDIYWILNPRLDYEYQQYSANQIQIEERQQIGFHLPLNKQSFTIQEREAVSKEKYEKFKAENKYKFYTTNKGIASKCLLIKSRLATLKAQSFYRHSLLQQIIDGEFWNGKIYGYYGFETYIFFKGKRVDIYPAAEVRGLMSEEQERMSNLLFAGLKHISEITDGVGICNTCKYNVDILFLNGNSLTVCNYEEG